MFEKEGKESLTIKWCNIKKHVDYNKRKLLETLDEQTRPSQKL